MKNKIPSFLALSAVLALAVLVFTGCFQERNNPVNQSGDQPPGAVKIGYRAIPGATASGHLRKASADEHFVVVEGTSGALTVTDTVQGDSGEIILADLASNRPWTFEAWLVNNGRIENRGESPPVFLPPDEEITVPLYLLPLFGNLRLELDSSQIPGYLENVSIRLQTPDTALQDMPAIELELAVDSTVPCSIFVIADFAGNVQVPAFSGFLNVELLAGQNSSFAVALHWTDLMPVPGNAVLKINVVVQGTANADISLDGHPQDSDGDGIPDPNDACPTDPDPLAVCDSNNIALNPSRTGFPHPNESDPGWGGGTDTWDIVDGERYYPEWTNGLALNYGGTRQITLSFGTPKTMTEMTIWHHVDFTGSDIPQDVFVHYYNDSTWVPVAFTRTYDLTAQWPSGYYGSYRDTYSFESPVMGTKIRWSYDGNGPRLSGSTAGTWHGWAYQVDVMGSEALETE